jgi:hypothetical protein
VYTKVEEYEENLVGGDPSGARAEVYVVKWPASVLLNSSMKKI